MKYIQYIKKNQKKFNQKCTYILGPASPKTGIIKNYFSSMNRTLIDVINSNVENTKTN